jgi:hypothetical protein
MPWFNMIDCIGFITTPEALVIMHLENDPSTLAPDSSI